MISLIILLVILGLIFWAISFLPIGEPFLTIVKVILIIIAVVAVLNAFGISTGLNTSLR
jgi:hypothetical protein